MDCSPQASLTMDFFRLLSGVGANSFSRGSNLHLLHCRQVLYHWATREALTHQNGKKSLVRLCTKNWLWEALTICKEKLCHIDASFPRIWRSDTFSQDVKTLNRHHYSRGYTRPQGSDSSHQDTARKEKKTRTLSAGVGGPWEKKESPRCPRKGDLDEKVTQ